MSLRARFHEGVTFRDLNPLNSPFPRAPVVVHHSLYLRLDIIFYLMPSPLDYPAFKRFVIANALTSGVFPLSEMTVMWLFLQGLHNLFLFSFVASSRPVTRIFASPIGGYIGDRFDRARTYTLTRLATPVTILGIMYCLLTHQYLLGIVLVYVRATISQLNSVVATTALYTLVPKELMVKAMAVNRFMKEPATVIGTLSWPFLLGLLGAKVLLISSSVLIITTLLVYKLKVSPGRKDVGFLTGFRLVKEKEEVRGAVVGIVFDQAGGAIVLNYLPYIIQLYGGGSILYSIAQALSYAVFLLGSYLNTRYKNAVGIAVLNLVLKISVFISLLVPSPWAPVYAVSAWLLGDAFLEVLWISSLRVGAGDDQLSSVLGVDESLTNVGRTAVLEVAPVLFPVGMFTVVSLGLALIGAEGIIQLLHKKILELEI